MTVTMHNKSRRKKMIVVLLVIFQVLGLVSAVHAIMSSRTPQGSIAWTVSLITFPYVSVPAYWVLGRNKFRGYTLARQHELEIIGDLIQQAKQRVEGIRAPIALPGGPVTGAEKMARIPLTGGNTVELLVDGEETFASIFEGIAAARNYILVQFYIVRDDKLGRELKSRLIAKAREGRRSARGSRAIRSPVR